MRWTFALICVVALSAIPPLGEGKLGGEKRIWILRTSGEMVEYDPATFAVKQTVKLPAEAGASPQSIAVNRVGQILFAPASSLPLAEEDVAVGHKAWLWDGKISTVIDLGLKRETAATGSNQAVTEIAPNLRLSEDGAHLFWFANQARRLQREDVDLSTTTTWQAWRTDLNGGAREDLATLKLPDCRCPTGACEESCPLGAVWSPEDGIADLFLMTQFVAAKTGAVYKASTLYSEAGGKWTATPLTNPLHRVLDAASGGSVIVEAIPDAGCCGWANQSDDQTLVRRDGINVTVFDELATFKNPDYDVSFFTSNARLSPDTDFVAMTITATAQANQPIQLAEQGQANPAESKMIRKALAELPAVEVKRVEDSPRRIAFVPHATLVGWISQKELLLVEDQVLVVFNVETSARKKSGVRVEDAGRVFLR
jgi:hypothetical protein